MIATHTPSPPPPFRIQNSEFRIRAPRAFTLIELMVVVAIIVILTAITLPAVKALTQGNSQKQAVNLVSALLANARGVAITSHKPAGLLFYEDPSSKSQTAAQVVIASTITLTTSAAPAINIIRAPSQAAQMLPYGVKIGTLANSNSTFFNTGDAFTLHGRIILFDENGQLLLQNNLSRDPNLTDAAAVAWNLSSDYSAPAIVIYDGNALQAALQSGQIASNSGANLFPWLQQHADILVINPYTGTIIR